MGETVAAGDPQIDVLSNGGLKIDVMVPENQVGLIAAGDEADITFDAYGASFTATGTVSSIDLSQTVTDGVGAYKTTVLLSPSAGPRIRAGMTANVSIGAVSVSQALAVPVSAVLSDGASSFVLMKQANGSYLRQQVETGISDGSYIQILSGISPGDEVASFGLSGPDTQ